MANGPLGIVASYLERIAESRAAKSDAELLALYSGKRDEEAFAILVDRHGPMVLGVCRRALGFSADADDAFQATFLNLARSANRIGTNVPGWLYRVAVRTSRKAIRRRSHFEASVDSSDPSDPFASVEWREIRQLLDEELERLPAKWRNPLVLCYLEGLTRNEAASRMGLSLRTLHRRLDEARSRLRERLTKRGLAFGLVALAALPGSDLLANVSPRLAGQTVSLVSQRSVVPVSIQTLLNTSSLRGLVMKTTLCAGVAALGFSLMMADRQPAAADPVPQVTPTTVFVRAPLKKERVADDKLTRKVRESQSKAIDYLKSQQKERADKHWNWEDTPTTLSQPGGTSCLAMLSLLESGLKADDEVVARGLKYLRTLKPQHTYVVGLQTQVFCKANRREDAERIKENVKLLEGAAARNAQGIQGWSYSLENGGRGRGDNSNTRYALAGLYAAHKVGFKTRNADFWEDVRSFLVRTQNANGGWGYVDGSPQVTFTMTCSGTLSLYRASEILAKEDKTTAAAMEAGMTWVGNEFRLENPPYTFYSLDVLAELGRASEKKAFPGKDRNIEWYKEGIEWLLKNQKATGEWTLQNPIDAMPVISTSFALRFLASRPD